MKNDQHNIETYKSLIAISTEGYKLLLVLNGGALVSIMTMLGQLLAKDKNLPNLIFSLYAFIGGLIACGLAMFFGYMTQLLVFNEENNCADIYLKIAIFSYLASLTLFGIGCYSAIQTLQTVH